MALNLKYYGCCLWFKSSTCSHNGCYCDQDCYIFNDCCSDIGDIGCHSATIISPTPTDTLGKTKSEGHANITHSYMKNNF